MVIRPSIFEPQNAVEIEIKFCYMHLGPTQ